MALWGSRDTFAVTGTAFANSTVNTTILTGTSTVFTTELDVGDTFVLAGTRRKIVGITSNTVLTFEPAWTAANVAGTVTGQDTPTYVPTSEIVANNIVGIDNTEAGIANNRIRGLSTPGWNKYVTYTDMHSRTRHKTEPLIVISGGLTSDAPDDTVAEDS